MSNSQTNIDLKDNIDDSESVASDESEETTEVDEDEYDRRRARIVNDMKELEFLFSKLKEALINEKQILIDQKLKEIEDETAEEFTIPLEKLKQNMEVKINLATLLKDYKCKNIEHIYQCEEKSANKSLENDKQAVYDKYLTKLETEIKDLEEKRRQFLLDYNLYQLSMNSSLDEQDNMNLDVEGENNDNLKNSSVSPNESKEENEENKKTKRSKKTSKTEKSNNVSSVLLHGSPYIVYSLQDYDILEDWSIIKMHSNMKINSN